MMRWSRVPTVATLAFLAGSFSQAWAAPVPSIDFTNDATWSSGLAGVNSRTLLNVLPGVNLTLTARPSGTLTYNKSSNDPILTIPPCSDDDLACDSDGIGIGDDEVSGTQSLLVEFSEAVFLRGFRLLDLFQASGATSDAQRESASVTLNGSTILGPFIAIETLGVTSGYLEQALTPTRVTSILFSLGTGKDDGSRDYALAGLDVSAIPLPAAGFLLIGGLAGLGFVSRKRKAA